MTWKRRFIREICSGEIDLYEKYHSISDIADELGMSTELVTMYLPYKKVVYDLENKSGNARRIQRWREKEPR